MMYLSRKFDAERFIAFIQGRSISQINSAGESPEFVVAANLGLEVFRYTFHSSGNCKTLINEMITRMEYLKMENNWTKVGEKGEKDVFLLKMVLIGDFWNFCTKKAVRAAVFEMFKGESHEIFRWTRQHHYRPRTRSESTYFTRHDVKK